LEGVLYGTPEPVSEFVMPVLAVKMAGLATEDTLSRLVGYFQELSIQHPMAIVIFISAVSANKETAKFATRNREFMDVAAKLGKYF